MLGGRSYTDLYIGESSNSVDNGRQRNGGSGPMFAHTGTNGPNPMGLVATLQDSYPVEPVHPAPKHPKRFLRPPVEEPIGVSCKEPPLRVPRSTP